MPADRDGVDRSNKQCDRRAFGISRRALEFDFAHIYVNLGATRRP
jgi:hypothetical protein